MVSFCAQERAQSYDESPVAGGAPSDALWPAARPPCGVGCSPSCADSPAVGLSSAPVRLCYTNQARRCVYLRRAWRRLQSRDLSRFLSGGGQGLHWHIGAGETDIPAIRFMADGDGFGSAFYWTDQRTAIRPILDRTRNPLSSVRPVAQLFVREAVIAVRAVEARIAGRLACLDAAKNRWKALSVESAHPATPAS